MSPRSTKAGKHRRVFGPSKYAAFHLLFSRWIRHYGREPSYAYVTLGGTELRDIEHLHFIDANLVQTATSFEAVRERAHLASRRAQALAGRGINVTARQGDFFSFVRSGTEPHIYFLDLEGICASADFDVQFARMFTDETLREGDALFITSYLGRHPGWDSIAERYDAQFRVLGVADESEKRICYRQAHPSFTLFRALRRAGLLDEILMRCLGSVEYHDSSPMGVYGYTFEPGRTALRPLVRNAPHLHVMRGTE
jgi:hypothetical protein